MEVKVGIIGDGAEEALQLVETQADGLPLPLLLSWVEEELPAGHRPGLPGRRRAGGWLPDSRRWRPAAAVLVDLRGTGTGGAGGREGRRTAGGGGGSSCSVRAESVPPAAAVSGHRREQRGGDRRAPIVESQEGQRGIRAAATRTRRRWRRVPPQRHRRRRGRCRRHPAGWRW